MDIHDNLNILSPTPQAPLQLHQNLLTFPLSPITPITPSTPHLLPPDLTPPPLSPSPSISASAVGLSMASRIKSRFFQRPTSPASSPAASIDDFSLFVPRHRQLIKTRKRAYTCPSSTRMAAVGSPKINMMPSLTVPFSNDDFGMADIAADLPTIEMPRPTPMATTAGFEMDAFPSSVLGSTFNTEAFAEFSRLATSASTLSAASTPSALHLPTSLETASEIPPLSSQQTTFAPVFASPPSAHAPLPSAAMESTNEYSFSAEAVAQPPTTRPGTPFPQRRPTPIPINPSQPRPFACPQCPATFHRKHDFTRHFRTHMGVRPHLCNLCGKTFGRHDALTRHLAGRCVGLKEKKEKSSRREGKNRKGGNEGGSSGVKKFVWVTSGCDDFAGKKRK
ncbi:hypothetical protein HK102_006216 [Quaeritorhiza haematococci]|nr:hypothetical protein HK102_006216 [Quaeritorhiza haematococci]